MTDQTWLKNFHAGDRALLERCYRDHLEVVFASLTAELNHVDRETIVHEVFYRLFSSPDFRASFRGGSLVAWLTTVARNHASDTVRRYRRFPHVGLDAIPAQDVTSRADDEATQARLMVDKFKRQVLPAKWQGVFQARFVEQRNQREAAALLGMARTTLVYQELRIRSLLRDFLLKDEP